MASAFVLALLLPVQGYAAACAQVCAQAKQERQAEAAGVPASFQAASGDGHDHCDDAETSSHKCCSAHTFLVDASAFVIAVSPAAQELPAPVARWKNFIPEEPSPPPIVAAIPA